MTELVRSLNLSSACVRTTILINNLLPTLSYLFKILKKNYSFSSYIPTTLSSVNISICDEQGHFSNTNVQHICSCLEDCSIDI